MKDLKLIYDSVVKYKGQEAAGNALQLSVGVRSLDAVPAGKVTVAINALNVMLQTTKLADIAAKAYS